MRASEHLLDQIHPPAIPVLGCTLKPVCLGHLYTLRKLGISDLLTSPMDCVLATLVLKIRRVLFRSDTWTQRAFREAPVSSVRMEVENMGLAVDEMDEESSQLPFDDEGSGEVHQDPNGET